MEIVGQRGIGGNTSGSLVASEVTQWPLAAAAPDSG